MVDTISELLALDWGVILGGIAVIIVAVPKIKKYLEDFETQSGFRFPWTTKKIKLEQRLKELDDKIKTTRQELDEKIDSIHTAEHQEHETWHQQSITIRDNLTANQHKLEENQSGFMKAIAEISESLMELRADFLDERLERKRWNILNCASRLRNNEYVDFEEFNNVFQDYDSYEDLISKHGLKNGLIEESIKFIREKYQEYICKEK